MSAPRLLLCAGLCLVLITGVVVYRDLRQLRRQPGHADGLSRGEVPLDEIPRQPSPFLEDHPLPQLTEHALLTEGGSAEPMVNLLGSDNPQVDTLSGEAPQELPTADKVSPVPLLTPEQRKENIAAIKKALPDISDERLEFWLEETRDMPPQMIHDMLMLRKHFGALSDSFTPDPSSLPPADGKPGIRKPDPIRDGLLKARSLVLQNRMNANSIGYLATEFVFVEDSNTVPSGVRLAQTRLSLEPGNLQFTQRPLDVAFQDATTFLVVRRGATKLLTRFGSLAIGPDRRLRLSIEGTDLLVSPGIVIPEGNDDVWIAASGDVFVRDPNPENQAVQRTSLGKLELKTVPDPAYLQPAGTACYLPTRRSGEIIDLPDTAASDPLQVRCLQGSNVDSQRNGSMRRKIDDLLQVWEGQNPVTRQPLTPIKQLKSWGGFQLDIF